MTLVVAALSFFETPVITYWSAWHNIPDNLKAVKNNFLRDVMPRDLEEVYRRLK
jgi:hypothetical protein